MRKDFTTYSRGRKTFDPCGTVVGIASRRRPVARTRHLRYPAARALAIAPCLSAAEPIDFRGLNPLPAVERVADAVNEKAGSWIWFCPLLMLVIGIIDTACTMAALQTGQLDELNPVMAYVIEIGGAPGLGIYRLTMTFAGCGLLLWALRMYRDGRVQSSSPARLRGMVWAGQTVLVVAHLTLAAWWTAWFLV